VLVAVLGWHVAAAGGLGRPRGARRALVYKTLLIWPYAVAPAVAGVLWLFMFAPSIGVVSYWLRSWASTGTTCSTATTPWR
jgi:sn-glycerol 3-phosphate transport system permease protein